MDLSGTPGELSVSGPADLTGTLAIGTKSGYVPAIGRKIAILTASSVKGKFTTVTGLQINSTEKWSVSYKSTSVVLTAVSG